MKPHEEEREFAAILSALSERELTDWERERLWELLEGNESRLSDFTDHCFLSSEIGALTEAQLAASGIWRRPANVVELPGSGPATSPRRRSLSLATSAIASCLLLLGGAAFLYRETPSDSTPTLAPGDSALPSQASPQTSAPSGPSPAQRVATGAPRRRANLNLDDRRDEAVALSGPAALANSRSPRGGQPVGASRVPERISFNHHVRPILSENCFFCHGPDEKMRKADLRLDTPDGATRDLGGYAALVPGKPAESEVWRRIIAVDPDELMPPPDSHRSLSESDREILRRWIEGGATYDAHWAFVPPQRPAVPQPQDAAWVKTPVDAFLLDRLEREGLAPNPPAPPRTLLRRLSLDLTGLPPSLQELADFETAHAQDPEAAVRAAVDRLLDSPHYGERMALPWLDAARYADSNGFQQDGNRHQWPWRDWVVRAYQNNLPFDRFTIEQLAGDLLPEPTQDQLIATAFNRNHMLNGEGGAIPEEQRINNVLDRVDTTATTWLALTMACAQCHSHKYDPISQEEYYRFFAFFNNLPESGVIDYRSGQGCAFGSGATVQLARPWISLPTPEQEAEKKRLEDAIKESNRLLDEKEAEILLPRRIWEKRFTAKDFEDRTRFPGSLSNILRTPEEKRNADQKRSVTEFFLRTGDHGREDWTRWGEEIQAQRDALRHVNESIVQVMIMEENPPDKGRETFTLIRGDYQQPDQKVTPGTPAFLPPMPADAPKNRLGLAQWLVSPDHPLTARVAVNRIWQLFFGIGIVKTSEDFGVQGELPVHPELLDWLAVEFVESGWDVKHLVRLLVCSAAYRQDGAFSPEKAERDPDNRLLARGARRRLPAMLLRDQALALSGLLVTDLGGEPVYPRQPEGLWEEFSFGKISYPRREEKEQLYRRSLYTFFRRTSAPPNLFDSSARQVCTVKATTTNTPLHALVLLNDDTYVAAARALGRRLIEAPERETAARLAHAFELATARAPNEEELRLLCNGHEKSLNEFRSFPEEAARYAAIRPDESHDPVELAAWVRMAQVILNLDETLNRP